MSKQLSSKNSYCELKTKHKESNSLDLSRKRTEFSGISIYTLGLVVIVVVGGVVILIGRESSKHRTFYKKTINFCLSRYLSLYRKANRMMNPFNRLYYKVLNPQKIVSIWVNYKKIPTKDISTLSTMELKDKDIIEVRWKTWGKHYRTVFNKDNIAFPIYSNKQLSQLTKNNYLFNIQKLLMASIYYYDESTDSYTCKDITDIIREYYGPFQDRYKNCEETINANQIYEYYMGISRKLLVHHKDYIEIMNHEGVIETINVKLLCSVDIRVI